MPEVELVGATPVIKGTTPALVLAEGLDAVG